MGDAPASDASLGGPFAGPGQFAGRVVLVCGARFAGAAAVRALLGLGARVLLADAGETEELPGLIEAGARFVGDVSEVPAGVELVVTSPGWRPDAPLLADAAARGLPILGEVEFAWRLRAPGAAPWLAVTGTNGKTTTVRMTESILRAAGHRTLAVGNVGVSVIDAVLAGDAYDVLAVELSSFQLYWSSTIRPAAGALLNLAPDHLDWHGTMSAYGAAKARVWDGAVAIGNADDAEVAPRLAAASAAPSVSPARWVGFTLGRPSAGQLGVVDGSLIDRAFGLSSAPSSLAAPPGDAPASRTAPVRTDLGDGVPLADVADVRPSGPHNVANALAAAALTRAVGVPPEAVAAGLRAFVPDPHRNQFVVRRDGVTYVDDSKATNPHAAAASLSAYEPIVWVAGGQLKGAPIDELVAQVARRLRAVVLLGADRSEIAAALARHAPDVPVIEVGLSDDRAMIEVVRVAARQARPGDTVLLAPAAASYDMFSGYAARGDAFAAAVRALGPT